MTDVVGHFLIFSVVAILMLAVPLLLGRFVRPKLPTPQKDSIYECGEPTIGTSYVQFDLRFYVVALLFIIFDVEVAFFFPWAMVFGQAVQIAEPRIAQDAVARTEISSSLLNVPAAELSQANIIPAETAETLAWASLVDVLVFFGVLMLGFAYVWKRGDLDWVKAVAEKAREQARQRSQPVA